MPVDIVLAQKGNILGHAKKLGYGKLIVVYNSVEQMLKEGERNTIPAVLIDAETKGKLLRDIEIARKDGALTIVRARNTPFDRFVLEKTGANIIFDLEYVHKKDHLHFRRSGLDQVLCKIAAKNEKIIGISLGSLMDAENKAQALGRIMQNIMFCRKYRVKMLVGSFAKHKNEMRGVRDVRSLLVTLGATQAKEMMEF